MTKVRITAPVLETLTTPFKLGGSHVWAHNFGCDGTLTEGLEEGYDNAERCAEVLRARLSMHGSLISAFVQACKGKDAVAISCGHQDDRTACRGQTCCQWEPFTGTTTGGTGKCTVYSTGGITATVGAWAFELTRDTATNVPEITESHGQGRSWAGVDTGTYLDTRL